MAGEDTDRPTSPGKQERSRRAAYERGRQRLLQDYRRRLAQAHPADQEALRQGYTEDWARIAQQHDAGRFPQRFLLYCTEWDPHKGGIVAVNRNLAEGLAEAGHEVFVRVGHPVPEGAGGERIHLIGPREYDPARDAQAQLAYDGEELPANVDTIIGHSRYSGPQALQVRDEHYPDTPFVPVVHMVTGALARVAKRPDLEAQFEGIERRMVADADMVAAVGPTLADEARRLAVTNPGDLTPPVHQITPGVPFEEQQLPPWDGERPRNVLVVGRADAPQKGAHHAALMVRRLRAEGMDVRLTVRGAPPETAEEIQEQLSAITGAQVTVKPFTIDRGEILADMRQSDVMVMPSRAEGFGLVGLEAAGAGVPVLVPHTSGVGAHLGDPNRFPPEVTRGFLVEQGFEDQVNVGRWTSQLRQLLEDIPTARDNAHTVQQLLQEGNTTWRGAAESLASAVQEIPDRSAPKPQTPDLTGLAPTREGSRADDVQHGGPATPDPDVSPLPTSAVPLPPHPETGASVVARQALDPVAGVANRELATFSDGSREVYQKYAQTQDARDAVLDAHVGHAAGVDVPLPQLAGLQETYTPHTPDEPASTRHGSLREMADRGIPQTRDGVLTGLHHTLTARHHLTPDNLVLGEGQRLTTAGSGAAAHGPTPDAENPFVRTFYRQVEPHTFDWVDNPLSPEDATAMRQRLDELRPAFDRLGRPERHEAIMQRFDQVADHAIGTEPLQTRAPGDRVILPEPRPQRRHPLPSLAPQERVNQQRIAATLVTDGGNITDVGQGKTIAINALAERMRSATPEFALAALGLNVGTDMVNRLGDDRYALVPRNPQFPSMGADVLRRDQLDQGNSRHAPENVVGIADPHANTLVRRIAVSEIMGAWAYGSNNNVRVLAMQEAAREEFGLTGTLDWQLNPQKQREVAMELDYNRDALRDFLSTQYEMTQELLAEYGITSVVGYRALTWENESSRPQWADRQAGEAIDAPQLPLSRWAADRQIAADWLEQRGGPGAILVERTPAKYVLSAPPTGMGFLPHQEWVALGSDRSLTLDAVHENSQETNVEHTAAATVMLGGPAVSGGSPVQEQGSAQPEPAPQTSQWRPLNITAQLDPANPVDSHIMRILNSQEQPPEWWPRDDSGYAITQRDLDYLGINPVQVKWMLTGEAPMGMTPELYHQFSAEMVAAVERDGADPSQVDIRIKGTGAEFFAGIHKTMPREEDLADNPAAQRLQEWFGDSPKRPQRRPYDAMWRLGLESEPSDVDLDINSSALVAVAREQWRGQPSGRYPGDFMGGHGYLDKDTVMAAFSSLGEWAREWEQRLGRPISLGIFESSGPFDETAIGRPLSAHFRDTDWIIHSPSSPRAWQNPTSRIAAPLTAQEAANPELAEAFEAFQRAQIGRVPTRARRPGQPAESDPPHRSLKSMQEEMRNESRPEVLNRRAPDWSATLDAPDRRAAPKTAAVEPQGEESHRIEQGESSTSPDDPVDAGRSTVRDARDREYSRPAPTLDDSPDHDQGHGLEQEGHDGTEAQEWRPLSREAAYAGQGPAAQAAQAEIAANRDASAAAQERLPELRSAYVTAEQQAEQGRLKLWMQGTSRRQTQEELEQVSAELNQTRAEVAQHSQEGTGPWQRAIQDDLRQAIRDEGEVELREQEHLLGLDRAELENSPLEERRAQVQDIKAREADRQGTDSTRQEHEEPRRRDADHEHGDAHPPHPHRPDSERQSGGPELGL